MTLASSCFLRKGSLASAGGGSVAPSGQAWSISSPSSSVRTMRLHRLCLFAICSTIVDLASGFGLPVRAFLPSVGGDGRAFSISRSTADQESNRRGLPGLSMAPRRRKGKGEQRSRWKPREASFDPDAPQVGYVEITLCDMAASAVRLANSGLSSPFAGDRSLYRLSNQDWIGSL